MNTTQKNGQGNADYLRLKKAVDENHPQGWFVAVSDEQIVAAAATFSELESMLQELGRDPRSTLVVQAGIEHPQYVTMTRFGCGRLGALPDWGHRWTKW